ncbi:unnamed protein product [Moneuplotes crassus]|uniref:Uncharacterized protein n=1 Tax=Euplotes crassus TaxID=5936 RepID=A0AAD1U3Z7_EUPCR|nr:unnamed protein product [Moneuplotes crassus]
MKSNILPEDGDPRYYQVIENGIRFTKVQPYASDKVNRWDYTNIPEIGMQKKEVKNREDIDSKALEIKHRRNIPKYRSQNKKRERSYETAPSIPSGHNKMLFVSENESEKDDEVLSKSSKAKNPKVSLIAEDEIKEVGPFSYNPNVNKIKKSNQAVGWSLSKSKRIGFNDNKDPEIGPGKYENTSNNIGLSGMVDPMKGTAQNFQNQSSIFKSNVERLSYMDPKIKTFMGGKLMKSRPSAKALEQSKSNIVRVPEISPGPGDYMGPEKTSTFNVETKPQHLQYFGSTEDRVPFYNRDKPKNDINIDFRGPGCYNNEHLNIAKVSPNQNHKGHSASFASGRHQDLLFAGNQNPAPGDYKSPTDMNKINGNVWSKNSTFGLTEKRFSDIISENPGPGSYTTVKKNKRKGVSNHMFKSGTKRSVFNLHKVGRQEMTNLQDYKSISSEINKLSGGAPNNFTVLQNEKLIMPFNSCSPRFKDANPTHLSTSPALGPGYYPDQVRQLKAPLNDNLSFGRSKRFADSKKTSLGPGQYNNHKKTTWVK